MTFAPVSFFPELFESQLIGLPTVRAGISGRITYHGASAVGYSILLLFFDGASWSTLRTATTQADGVYQFTDAPTLMPGQGFRVRYNGPDSNFVNLGSGPAITSYTAGSSIAGGSFDIANIPQTTPTSGATITLPYTFQWTKRSGAPSDSYILEIYDGGDYWASSPLGYVDQYTLNSLPPELTLGAHWWDVLVNYADGSFCYSFDQSYAVTLS